MNILIDIGNARIKWAQVENGRLSMLGQALHVGAVDLAFEALATALPENAERILVSNVAGEDFAVRLTTLARRRFGVAPEFAGPVIAEFGVQCAYPDSSAFGIDRWLAIIAAHNAVDADVCVIDAGTAVTFDAIDANGQHLGGLILASPRLVARALSGHTHSIDVAPRIGNRPSGLDLLASSTDAAVGNGAMLSVAAALDHAAQVVAAGLGASPTVFLTGGDGPLLAGWLETEMQLRADLVLEGLALVMLGERDRH